METWMQNGIYLNVPGGPLTQADCFACHQPQTVAQPAKDKAKAFNQGDMSHIFSRVAQ
jgi:hypothetical protein